MRCGLILVGIVLAWKLLRFADPTFTLWRAHVFVVAMALLISVPSFFRAWLVQRAAMANFVLIFVMLAFVRLVYFQTVDPFSFAVSTFFLYFLLERWFRHIEVNRFFHAFKFLLVLLLLVNVLDFMNLHLWSQSLFDYGRAERWIEQLDLSGLESVSGTTFGFTADGVFKFVGRPPGISGTPYATSALIAAGAIFFHIVGYRAMFFLSVLLLGGWATGSTILVFLFVMLCLSVRRWYFPFAFAGATAIALVIMVREGISDTYWTFEFGFDALDVLVASVIGEGRHVSSIVSEFRIIGLLASLGLLGVLALAGMAANYWICMKAAGSRAERTHYRAGLWFMATLLLCNWHYPTLFVFPNIVFVVGLFAFAGSRATRARLSESASAYSCLANPDVPVRMQRI